MPNVKALTGIYDADGGLRGEASYVLGKMLGTSHCALCDVTHSPLRRKPAWDAMVTRLAVPFTLLHRNELTVELTQTVAGLPLATVLAQVDGENVMLLSPDQLDAAGGDVEEFERVVREAIAAHGWTLGSPPGDHAQEK